MTFFIKTFLLWNKNTDPREELWLKITFCEGSDRKRRSFLTRGFDNARFSYYAFRVRLSYFFPLPSSVFVGEFFQTFPRFIYYVFPIRTCISFRVLSGNEILRRTSTVRRSHILSLCFFVVLRSVFANLK